MKAIQFFFFLLFVLFNEHSPSLQLLVRSEQLKEKSNVKNVFKVNKKDTRTTSIG